MAEICFPLFHRGGRSLDRDVFFFQCVFAGVARMSDSRIAKTVFTYALCSPSLVCLTTHFIAPLYDKDYSL